MAMADEPCRVCFNSLDATDQGLQACECGFQVCLFCYHKIKETGNGQCPGCRTAYGEKPIRFDVSKEALEKERASKRKQTKNKRTAVPRDGLSEEEKEQWVTATATAERQRLALLQRAGRGRSESGATATSTSAAPPVARAVSAPEAPSSSIPRPKSATPHPGQTLALTRLASRSAAEREQLRDARVIQRNLVYVTGLAPQFARSETLSRAEYFGMYGEVVKVVVNRQNLAASNGRPPSASAYITYRTEEQAATAVRSVTGFRLEGRVLKASFGTNKYCATFLRGTPCVNADCMYLHLLGSSTDSFSKEQMSDARFIALTTPTAGGSALAAAEADAVARAKAAATKTTTDAAAPSDAACRPPTAGATALAASASKASASKADATARGAASAPRHRAPHQRLSLAALNATAGVMDAENSTVRAFQASDSVATSTRLTTELLVPGVKPDPSPEPLPGLKGRVIHQWPSSASHWVMAHDGVCAAFVLAGAAPPNGRPLPESVKAAEAVAAAVAPDTDDGATWLASAGGAGAGAGASEVTIAALTSLERIASGIVAKLACLRPDGQLPTQPSDPAMSLPHQLRVAKSLSEAEIPLPTASQSTDDAADCDEDDDDEYDGDGDGDGDGDDAQAGGGSDARAGADDSSAIDTAASDAAGGNSTAGYDDDEGARGGGSRRKQRHRKRGGNRRRGAQTVTK